MGDMFQVGVSGLNTTSNSVSEYGQRLQNLLEEFDSVMTTLTNQGLNGGMDEAALAAYNSVKDSLDVYAANIISIGSAIGNVASRTSEASKALSEAIGVN